MQQLDVKSSLKSSLRQPRNVGVLLVVLGVTGLISTGLAATACGGTSGSDLFGTASSPTDPGAPGTSDTSAASSGGEGHGSAGPDDPSKPPPLPSCPVGTKTTLTGKVYDPANVNALHDVLVYVPSGPLATFTSGAACAACGSIVPAPIAQTHSRADGTFVLENVPVGANVPVVVQMGKFRRKLEVSVTKACAKNVVPDHTLRLPKNGAEGELPHLAVTAGGCDALECLLRGIGIDDAEFVPGASMAGHIHVFAGGGGIGVDGSPAAGDELWNDLAKLKPYDGVLLSCECDEQNDNKGGEDPHARQAMHDYASMGGRVIASHFHYTWLKNSPAADFQNIASWGGSGAKDAAFSVDTDTADGTAFAHWLLGVNASTTLGQIQFSGADVTDSVSSVNAPASTWMRQATTPRVFSFATPIGPAAACGRVTFTDLHMMGISSGGEKYPAGCPAAGALTAPQKALEYFVFDQFACE